MRYFVYDLVDPRTGRTFYVGKGCRNRPHAHVREALSGVQSHKCNVIRKILARGMQPEIRIVYQTRVEKFAYRCEIARIAHFGLENLTNVTSGGPGVGARSRSYLGENIPLLDVAMITSPTPVRRTSAWARKSLNRFAPQLARHLLLAANGHAVEVGGFSITKLILGALAQIIGELGATAVRQRLLRENLYFLGTEVVQIDGHVMAEIRASLKRPQKTEKSRNLPNYNRMLTN